MKKIFITIILLPAFILSCAQVVWRGEKDYMNIGNKIFILEDKTGALNIGQVSGSNYDKQFILSSQSILHFGFTESVYWLKFSLQNDTNDSLWLQLAHAFIPNADLYFKDASGTWKSYKAGYKINLSEKIIKDHYQVFPLTRGTNLFYARITPYVHPIPVKIWKNTAYEIQANKQKIFFGIYAGILLFAIAVNIFLFLAFKKNYYLQYSILVFLYMASAAAVMEGYIVYFIPDIDLMYWYKVIPVLDMPALLLYCMSFLELKKYSRKIYRISFFACVYFGLYVIWLHFLPFMTVLIFNYVYALLVFILATCIGITVGRKGNKLGYYFAIAYSVWFILLAIEELYIQIGKPEHILEISYVSIAIFIESFLLAFLLVKRFQWEKTEDTRAKIQMQNNMNEMEQKFHQEILQTQLEIQEQTLHNISQEIHDNIGQTLSVIKLNIGAINSQIEKNDREKISQSKELIDKVIQDLRDLAKTLNTDYIQNIGLMKAIGQQLQVLQRTGIFSTQLEVTGEIYKCDVHTELLLYRIVQELLNNSVKHAGAKMIEVHVTYDQTKLNIIVKDDGRGFEIDHLNIAESKGLGLQNIKNRVKLIKGNITIDSKPSYGTIVDIELPKN
jgi:signal transduction histidine kinase